MTVTYEGSDTYKLLMNDGQKIVLTCDQISEIKSHNFRTNKVGKSPFELEDEIEDMTQKKDEIMALF